MEADALALDYAETVPVGGDLRVVYRAPDNTNPTGKQVAFTCMSAIHDAARRYTDHQVKDAWFWIHNKTCGVIVLITPPKDIP